MIPKAVLCPLPFLSHLPLFPTKTCVKVRLMTLGVLTKLSFPNILCCLMLLCPCHLLASVNNGRYPFICRLISFWNHLKCWLYWEDVFCACWQS